MRWARGHMVFTKSCAACLGTGRKRSERCTICFGQGRSARTEAVAVHVPPGAQQGSRLRVAQRGHAGRNGGVSGNLFVTVHVEPHPVYRREGDDLHMVLPIGIDEAALGERIDVATLDGSIGLRLLPGRRPEQRLRCRVAACRVRPAVAGTLVAEVQIVMPAIEDERAESSSGSSASLWRRRAYASVPGI